MILEALTRGEVQGAASEALFLEYRDVLGREDNLRQFWLSSDEVNVLIGALAQRLRPVTIHFRWRPQLTDPDDERVLECAINAMAEGIVTFNVTDFLPAAGSFGIEVLRPAEFLRRMNLASRRGP